MIVVSDLGKYYGDKRALGPVSFSIGEKESVGFLGLNGAGKTTVLRILAGDLRPSNGALTINGVDAIAHPEQVRKHVGFVPEAPPVYAEMTVLDYLLFAGRIRGMDNHKLRPRLDEVLALTHLTAVAHQVIGTLSHGYRQRVGVAQGIVHEPKLLILDEPTRGLDPVQIVEMRHLLNELKTRHTLLVSSHILAEISQTCDRLLILGQGAIVGQGTEQELVASSNQKFQVVVGVAIPTLRTTEVASLLAAVSGVDSVAAPVQHGESFAFELATSRDVRAAIARAIIAGGFDLVRLDHAVSELEQTFVRLVGAPAPRLPTARSHDKSGEQL